MKKKKIIIIVIILTILIVIGFSTLLSNKTFFKDKYIGMGGQEIYVPRYSFFKQECCMTVAEFHSLRSEKYLKKQIDKYMSEFEYFEDEHTYGYKKGDLFIQNYTVVNKGLYRIIYITY